MFFVFFKEEFSTYLKYCRNLKFEERPDYNWMKGLFRNLLYKLEYTMDNIFDWTKLNQVKLILLFIKTNQLIKQNNL